jgi:hypothetical protein
MWMKPVASIMPVAFLPDNLTPSAQVFFLDSLGREIFRNQFDSLLVERQIITIMKRTETFYFDFVL